MEDYEVLMIANMSKPFIGMLRLTVSEDRIGLYKPVLETIGNPNYIKFQRGVNANAGKLVLEAAEEDEPGAIHMDYDRKKFSFFSRDFIEMCKDMVRKYAGGEFAGGVYYAVKGTLQDGGRVVFDFHVVEYHQVKMCEKTIKAARNAAKSKAVKVKKNSFDTPQRGFAIPGMGTPGMTAQSKSAHGMSF